MRARLFGIVAAFGFLTACSPGGGGPGGTRPGVDGGGGRMDAGAAETGVVLCTDGIDNDGDGAADCLDPDCAGVAECGGRPDAGSIDGFMECGGELFMGDNLLAPVDIIWVVDSSNSMENDATVVQMNLDRFAADIEARSIDFHVVLISDRGFVTPSARFGTDPRFLFINRSVGSNDAFDRVLDQFPAYMDHLRPMAITHVVGVTDDDEDMAAATFIGRMEGLLGHSFTYHAIASPPGECNSTCVFGCRSCISGAAGCERPGSLLPAAAPGDEHYRAASDTMGLTFSICTSDWSGLFDTLARTVAVSMALPCAFAIPDPPAGMSFDRDRVNIEHTPAGGAPTPFPRVGAIGACGGSAAWYYDDPAAPTSIILCPAACTAVSAGPGVVQVRLGCATLLI